MTEQKIDKIMQKNHIFSAANQNGSSGHRKRLRDKFLFGGGRSLYNYEKLELLLTYSIPRRDVKPLAKALLSKFESFRGLMNASLDEITEIPGISENSAALILLVKELCCDYLEEKIYEKPIIEHIDEVVNFARMKIGGYPKEIYMFMYLDSRNHLLNYDCMQPGTIDRSVVHSREVVERILKNKAASVIVIHNHPSRMCLPSEQDLMATCKLVKALNAIEIRLFDHIIVSDADFHSMAAHNELPKQII